MNVGFRLVPFVIAGRRADVLQSADQGAEASWFMYVH
jgi:hypothetical protein